MHKLGLYRDQHHKTYRHLHFDGWLATFICTHCSESEAADEVAMARGEAKAQAEAFRDKHKDCVEPDRFALKPQYDAA